MRRRPGVATALAIAASWGAPGDGLAQVSGSIGVDSVDRYRGEGADGTGPIVEATLSGDTPQGFYAALAAHYHLHEHEVTVADGLLGWSGRFQDPAQGGTLDPAWGWDVGFHRHLEGDGLEFGASEWMVGLLGPSFDARLWYSRNYFGTNWHSLYGEINASHAFGEHWQAFAHVGYLHYSALPYGEWPRPQGHTDGRIGVSWNDGAWTWRLARDAMLSGPAYGTDEMRRPAWIAGAEFAF